MHHEGYVNITLFINKNAMSGAYMGNDQYLEGESPFGINPVTLTAVNDNTVATFRASINGTTVTSAKYYLDFSSTRSVVWSTDCQRSAFTGFGSGPCSTAPVNAKMHYDSSEQQSLYQTFTDESFGGFTVSGDIYLTLICFGTDTNCRYSQVYSGTKITADAWLYQESAEAGILGMGVESPFWNSFINPGTLSAIYSINLSNKQINFGTADDNDYQTLDSLALTSLANYTYSLTTFQFGIVYTDNGTPQSQYFEKLDNWYPVQFATNFFGIGLPPALYDQMTPLLADITNNEIECMPDNYNYCQIQQSCANVTADFANMNDFAFKFEFVSNSNSNYLRVPLSAFMADGSAYNTCLFYVQKLGAADNL